MTVLVLQSVAPSLRGELSRWMLEVRAGVFVGKVSDRVRELLWEKVVNRDDGGSAIFVFSADTEQGFAIRCHGDTNRMPVDFDGITLMRFVTARATKDKN